jgi:hypothetical protein
MTWLAGGWLALATVVAAGDPLTVAPAQSSGPALSAPTVSPDFPVTTGASYWIVSSRHASQHRLQRSPYGLAYCRKQEDGSLVVSDAAALQAELTPGVPVCIMVHGSFVDWNWHVEDTGAAYAWIRNAAPDRPLHVIFFTWASGGPYTHCFAVDVNVRGERAEYNGFHLAHLISQLPESSPVCIIGHSHGARVAVSAMHLAGGGVVQDLVFTGNVGARPLRSVLAAAAVDHHWLNPGSRYDCALCRGDVLNLRNRCDLALQFYPLTRPFSRPSLANIGFTDGDRERLGWLAVRAGEIDVTGLIGRHHNWPHYHDAPAIAAVIAPFVYFMDRDAVPAAASDTVRAAPPSVTIRSR